MLDRAPTVVLVAPDSFTGSLRADEAAAAVEAGLRAAAATGRIALDVRALPLADGGEGTVDVLVATGWERRERAVRGPTGGPVQASYALSPSAPRTAVVELAYASGLGRLPGGRPAPLTASTYGTGELVAAALDEGVDRLVLGLGGSATTDGGTGMAAALGARFLDAAGDELPPGGGALVDLDRVDTSELDARLAGVDVVAASDVDSPLVGPSGAAHVFGPQKGATRADVEVLDRGLTRLAAVLGRDLGIEVAEIPGAGAAGGTGAGALAFLGARIVPGADLVLDLLGFDAALTGADLLVTGEGSLDGQTLSGKAPLAVARRAHAAGVPVLALAGRVDLTDGARAELAAIGVEVRSLAEVEPDEIRRRRDAAALLRELAARAFTDRHTLTRSS